MVEFFNQHISVQLFIGSLIGSFVGTGGISALFKLVALHRRQKEINRQLWELQK